MRVRTAADVGVRVRALRIQRGLTQSQVAQRARVSRKWLSDLERGKASVSLDLLLRVVITLGGELDLRPEAGRPEIDLGAIVEAHRRQ